MQKRLYITTLSAFLCSSPIHAEIEIVCNFSLMTKSSDAVESSFPGPSTAIGSNLSPLVVERKPHEGLLEIPGDEGVRHFLLVQQSRETFVSIVTVLPDGRGVKTSHWGDPANSDTELRSDSDVGTCEVIE
jgi:hypothetical protein